MRIDKGMKNAASSTNLDVIHLGFSRRLPPSVSE